MDKQGDAGPEATGPEQSTPAVGEEEIYDGLLSAGLEERQAFRATQAIREQAGRNVTDKLETLQQTVLTAVSGLETRLTAKVDRVDAKVDGVRTELTAEIAAVRTELTAKVDGVRTELIAKVDGVRMELTAEIAAVRTELEVVKGKLGSIRWTLSFAVGFLALVVIIIGLAPLVSDWLGRDSPPAEAGPAPVESDRIEPAEPPAPDPGAPPPPQAGALLRHWQWFPRQDPAWEPADGFQVLASGSHGQLGGRFRSSSRAARLVPDRREFCGPLAEFSPPGATLGNAHAWEGWHGGIVPYPQALPASSGGWIPAQSTQRLGRFQIDRRSRPGDRAALLGACLDSFGARWQPASRNHGIQSLAIATFSAAPGDVSMAVSTTPLPFLTCGRPLCRGWPMASDSDPASGWTRAAAPFTAIARNPLQSLGD